MRLFVALRFSREALAAVEAVQHSLKAQCRSGSFTRRENLHLTLSFLGETASDRMPALRELLTRTAKGARPFLLHFDRLGFFPDRSQRQLCYLTADTPPELASLAAALQNALRNSGFPGEDREFIPHVTLARRCVLSEIPSIPAPVTAHFSELVLIRSLLQPTGPVYTPLFTASFGRT